ncbi:hypothetical protein T11_16179, partial [Trichinella zimbabwensis]
MWYSTMNVLNFLESAWHCKQKRQRYANCRHLQSHQILANPG